MNEIAEQTAGDDAFPLTFPPEEAAWVRECYGAARVILEYGSGGSTVLAASQPGKQVFSVESDRRWARRLRRHLDAAALPSPVTLHHADIGLTGKWGRPVSDAGWRGYHAYPLSVWDRPGFVPPDLILIDGRFRPACLLTALLRSEQPVTVLFDDYVGRATYRAVERFIAPAATRGRMARFEIEPAPLPRAQLTEIIRLFNEPF
ncbi:MAG: hypothetical protein CVT80_12330 [Alphaproteobacteria bacterium HGW-Alphaproteobacteria-2]|nr:MAG: hypothetical protein CVT80_12330 [Alphaproteobacteria bacterium HGW-Alphaproteobacteria-2]